MQAGDPVKLWIAGNLANEPWDVLGVFDTETAAIAACHSKTCFVGPIRLNEKLPDRVSTWPDIFFPREQVALQ